MSDNPSVKIVVHGEKKLLEERLFQQHGASGKVAMLSTKEVVRFLQLAGKSHRSGLSHYTSIDSLDKILGSRRLLLAKGSEMNDLCECKYGDPGLWERSYIASFSHGRAECVAMWKMYGEKHGDAGSEAIRITFPNSALVERAGTLSANDLRSHNCKTGQSAKLKGRECKVSIHDVMYQYGKSVEWDRQRAGIGRCTAFENAKSEPVFATYVKDYGWAYERETRLVVTLSETCCTDHVSIPLESVIDKIEVLLGPCRADVLMRKERRVADLFKKYGLRPRIEKSTYEIKW